MATSRRLARSSSAPILLTLPLTRQCPCEPPTTRITVTADAFLSCLPCCPPPLPAAVSGANCPSCLPDSLHGLCDCALLLTHIALLLSRHLCRFSQPHRFTLHALSIAQCECELLHVCTRNSKGMLEAVDKASMRLFLRRPLLSVLCLLSLLEMFSVTVCTAGTKLLHSSSQNCALLLICVFLLRLLGLTCAAIVVLQHTVCTVCFM